MTVVSSLTRLARLGVLVKGGEQLDRLAEVRTLAFDKTGTLTRGRPRSPPCRAATARTSRSRRPRARGAMTWWRSRRPSEGSSEHPIAHAIMARARERGLTHRYPAGGGRVAAAGRGVTGELRGVAVSVGTEALMSARGADAGVGQFARLTEIAPHGDAGGARCRGRGCHRRRGHAARGDAGTVLDALRSTVPGCALPC